MRVWTPLTTSSLPHLLGKCLFRKNDVFPHENAPHLDCQCQSPLHFFQVELVNIQHKFQIFSSFRAPQVVQSCSAHRLQLICMLCVLTCNSSERSMQRYVRFELKGSESTAGILPTKCPRSKPLLLAWFGLHGHILFRFPPTLTAAPCLFYDTRDTHHLCVFSITL